MILTNRQDKNYQQYVTMSFCFPVLETHEPVYVTVEEHYINNRVITTASITMVDITKVGVALLSEKEKWVIDDNTGAAMAFRRALRKWAIFSPKTVHTAWLVFRNVASMGPGIGSPKTLHKGAPNRGTSPDCGLAV